MFDLSNLTVSNPTMIGITTSNSTVSNITVIVFFSNQITVSNSTSYGSFNWTEGSNTYI